MKGGKSLECEILLAHVLGVLREYLLAHGDEEVSDDLCKLFDHYLKRVSNGEPVAYIVQEKEFFGLNFYVDSRVLVPRPETEMIVEMVLEYLKYADNGRRYHILDMGTGSGNIAVSIAKNAPEDSVEIFAVDIDNGALEVARLNAEQHGVDNLIEIFQSDLLENVSGEFDIIVANLPYVSVKNDDADESVKKYEPHRALYGGASGLELYEELFNQLLEKRINFDLMIGEFGFGQGDNMRKLLNKKFDHAWRIEKDLSGIDRLFVVHC